MSLIPVSLITARTPGWVSTSRSRPSSITDEVPCGWGDFSAGSACNALRARNISGTKAADQIKPERNRPTGGSCGPAVGQGDDRFDHIGPEGDLGGKHQDGAGLA